MQHRLKFKSLEEKINIWLDLCDFTFKLISATLSPTELRKKLKKMREVHLRQDYLLLSKIARIK